jgi:hypothetical protein
MAVPRFQTTLDSGDVLLEWSPGVITILEKSSREELDIADVASINTLAEHIDTSAYLGDPNDRVVRFVLWHDAQMAS